MQWVFVLGLRLLDRASRRPFLPKALKLETQTLPETSEAQAQTQKLGAKEAKRKGRRERRREDERARRRSSRGSWRRAASPRPWGLCTSEVLPQKKERGSRDKAGVEGVKGC